VTALPNQCWQWHEVAVKSCWCGTVEATWLWCAVELCRRWCCRGDISRDVTLLLSHAGDGIVESCSRWRYRGDVGHGVMSLSGHAGDGAALSCW
jgi:hypothetical protein